jgi:hypothetical protein
MITDTESTLLEETQRLLQETDKPLLEIYRETGLNFYWLRKMASRSIPEPGVNKVQKLYEYLTQTKLSV